MGTLLVHSLQFMSGYGISLLLSNITIKKLIAYAPFCMKN